MEHLQVEGEKLRTSDVARLAAVSPQTILLWAKSRKNGFPPPRRLGLRVLRWDKSAIIAWLESAVVAS